MAQMMHHSMSSSEVTNKHTMSTQELKSNLSELKSSMSEMKSSLSSHLVSAAAAAAAATASNPAAKFASAGLLKGKLRIKHSMTILIPARR